MMIINEMAMMITMMMGSGTNWHLGQFSTAHVEGTIWHRSVKGTIWHCSVKEENLASRTIWHRSVKEDNLALQ